MSNPTHTKTDSSLSDSDLIRAQIKFNPALLDTKDVEALSKGEWLQVHEHSLLDDYLRGKIPDRMANFEKFRLSEFQLRWADKDG